MPRALHVLTRAARLHADADTAKGSFYANPLTDAPTDDAALAARCVAHPSCSSFRLYPRRHHTHATARMALRVRVRRTQLYIPAADSVCGAFRAHRYPHYCRPNIWPAAALPELEGAVKTCGALIVQVGLLLAAHCDAYVVARGAGAAAGRLRRTIQESRCVACCSVCGVAPHLALTR